MEVGHLFAEQFWEAYWPRRSSKATACEAPPRYCSSGDRPECRTQIDKVEILCSDDRGKS